VTGVAAVQSGGSTYQDIAAAIHMDWRQGRYHRLAAELMGFVVPIGPNEARITDVGRAMISAEGEDHRRLLIEGLLRMRLFQRVVPFLEAHKEAGCTREQLQRFIGVVTERTGPTMVPRRTSTIIAWLREVGLVEQHGRSYHLCALPDRTGVIAYANEAEPLLPSRWDLAEYREVERRTRAARGSITYTVADVLWERASATHEKLTNLVAERLRRYGSVPRRNQFIDLAATVRDELFIFEVKSTTAGNARDQVRRGISQLYEYRYIQRAPTANLVLVLENPLPAELRWMSDFLSDDRGILPVWDGNLRRLYCPKRYRQRLAFLL
jgi:hypothetical protein